MLVREQQSGYLGMHTGDMVKIDTLSKALKVIVGLHTHPCMVIL